MVINMHASIMQADVELLQGGPTTRAVLVVVVGAATPLLLLVPLRLAFFFRLSASLSLSTHTTGDDSKCCHAMPPCSSPFES